MLVFLSLLLALHLTTSNGLPVPQDFLEQCEPGSGNMCFITENNLVCVCKPCMPGHYQNENGRKRCLPCPIGTMMEQDGSMFCIPCPLGHYNNLRGQPKCFPCQEGTWTHMYGQAKCVPLAGLASDEPTVTVD
jgi:hypothetical protein